MNKRAKNTPHFMVIHVQKISAAISMKRIYLELDGTVIIIHIKK